LIDSAAQVSLVGDFSLFISYTPFACPRPLQGAFAGNEGMAHGIGSILLHVQGPHEEVTPMQLQQVYYVEAAKSNLIAVCTLMEQGYSMHFAAKTGLCSITSKEGETIAQIPQVKGLWPLPVVPAPTPQVAHVHLKATQSDILHLKLGHLSHTGIKFLVDNQKLAGLPRKLGETLPCHSCDISKFPKRKFPRLATVHPHSRILSKVSMDTMGPFRTTSRGGARYSLTIVDHHTRYTWARPLSTKSQVPHHVLGWANQVRNLKSTTIQVLRTDRGGEFLNKILSEWAHKEGIHHETSIPDNPQQNGLAECHNKLLTSIARTSLIWSGAPNHWWGEAMVSAAHTLNHWPATHLQGDTPIAAWSGECPSIKNLHPWGCTAYTRIDPSQRSDPKLGPRGRRCMYIGPSATSKGFRFYDPEARTIFESRDVIWYDTIPFYAQEPNPKPDSSSAQFQDPFQVEKEGEDDSDDDTLPEPSFPSKVIPPPPRPDAPHNNAGTSTNQS
jgi:hypothetical protein